MPDTTPPLVSVIVPTCDRPELLRRCLDRLRPGAQSLNGSAYEVIVADDGSRVSARAALADAYSWARVVDGPRRGPAANRNAGARAARSAYLAFTDDDTVPSAQWLASYVAAADSNAEVFEGRTTCERGFGSPLYHAPINEDGGKFWSCNFFLTAAAFARVHGFDEGFRHPHMEDQDLRLRLEAAGYRIRFVPEAIVDHPQRRQPDGARLGMYRESEVRFMYRHGSRRPVGPMLLRKIVRYRLGVIRHTPTSFDSLRALWSLFRELAYVAGHLREWETRFAAEFPPEGATSP